MSVYTLAEGENDDDDDDDENHSSVLVLVHFLYPRRPSLQLATARWDNNWTISTEHSTKSWTNAR